MLNGMTKGANMKDGQEGAEHWMGAIFDAFGIFRGDKDALTEAVLAGCVWPIELSVDPRAKRMLVEQLVLAFRNARAAGVLLDDMTPEEACAEVVPRIDMPPASALPGTSSDPIRFALAPMARVIWSRAFPPS